tara:strand:- start:391 stop:609 length:219 start_codon:yes stop_codon:yes gene_type:complete
MKINNSINCKFIQLTINKIDELRSNLELLKDNYIISEFTYDNEYEKLSRLEIKLEEKIIQELERYNNIGIKK